MHLWGDAEDTSHAALSAPPPESWTVPEELVGFLLSDTNIDVTDWMVLFALAAGKLKVRSGTQPEPLSCPSPGV